MKLWKHQIHRTSQQDVQQTKQRVPLLVETSPWPQIERLTGLVETEWLTPAPLT